MQLKIPCLRETEEKCLLFTLRIRHVGRSGFGWAISEFRGGGWAFVISWNFDLIRLPHKHTHTHTKAQMLGWLPFPRRSPSSNSYYIYAAALAACSSVINFLPFGFSSLGFFPPRIRAIAKDNKTAQSYSKYRWSRKIAYFQGRRMGLSAHSTTPGLNYLSTDQLWGNANRHQAKSGKSAKLFQLKLNL